MKLITRHASSAACWLFVFLALTSCSLTNRLHRQSSSSSYSSVSVSDSLSHLMHLTSWSGSTTDITMHQIIFDTSRLDSTGHPLPASETITILHRQDTARSVMADTVTSVAHADQQQAQVEQQTLDSYTRSKFLLFSDVICLAFVVIACVIMFRIFSRQV